MINAYVKKRKDLKEKNLTLYLEELENEKQTKPMNIFQHTHLALHKNLNTHRCIYNY